MIHYYSPNLFVLLSFHNDFISFVNEILEEIIKVHDLPTLSGGEVNSHFSIV